MRGSDEFVGIVAVQGEASRRLCIHVRTRAMAFVQKGNWNFRSAELVGTTVCLERGGRPSGRGCGKLKWRGEGSGSELGLSGWASSAPFGVGTSSQLWQPVEAGKKVSEDEANCHC